MNTKRFSKRAAITALIGLGMTLNSGNAAACSSDPYLGEICLVGFNFCPRGFAAADGQILPIDQNQSLFSLFGTTFGGDGRTSFALPDLRGRSPAHLGSSISLGQKGGTDSNILSSAQMPSHTHSATTAVTVDASSMLHASNAEGDSDEPGGKLLAKRNRTRIYSTDPQNVDMSADAISNAVVVTPGTTINNAGSSIPLDNRSPFLGVSYCVAISGLFPSRN